MDKGAAVSEMRVSCNVLHDGLCFQIGIRVEMR